MWCANRVASRWSASPRGVRKESRADSMLHLKRTPTAMATLKRVEIMVVCERSREQMECCTTSIPQLHGNVEATRCNPCNPSGVRKESRADGVLHHEVCARKREQTACCTSEVGLDGNSQSLDHRLSSRVTEHSSQAPHMYTRSWSREVRLRPPA